MEKTAAVFHGGELEWAALYNDDDIAVRGAVACRASEEYQLKLVNDPVPAVRKMLAQYGTDKVRLANLDKSLFYRDIREATRTISVILFGAENFRDF